MQLTSITIKDLEYGACSSHCGKIKINRYNTEENIKGGICYYSCLYKKFKNNVPLSLAAYNAGPTKIAKNCKKSFDECKKRLKPETQAYPGKVISAYSSLV
jgi:soluble lytic murein transglycosylase-like protein